jgi:hypothetical protein
VHLNGVAAVELRHVDAHLFTFDLLNSIHISVPFGLIFRNTGYVGFAFVCKLYGAALTGRRPVSDQ